MNSLQPIETAPKDGSDILLLNSKGYSVGRWKEEVDGSFGVKKGSNWIARCCGWDVWSGVGQHDVEIDNPTHWMKLPEIESN